MQFTLIALWGPDQRQRVVAGGHTLKNSSYRITVLGSGKGGGENVGERQGDGERILGRG